MLKFLKNKVRQVQKNPTFWAINILGLAIGIAVFILISLYVRYEYNWDTFHDNYNQIYRVELTGHQLGQEYRSASMGFMVPDELRKRSPEILEIARYRSRSNLWLVETKNNLAFQADGLAADNSFLKIFSFDILQGDKDNVLIEKNSIVLTRSLANKIFPDEEAVGKTVRYNNIYQCTVTGIIEDIPNNSSLKFDFLVSILTEEGNWYYDWNNTFLNIAVLIDPKISPNEISEKIKYIYQEETTWKGDTELFLFPFRKLHLEPSGDMQLYTTIFLFSIFAIFILIVAYLNSVNLSLAHSFSRIKEIQIKKINGASRPNLIGQFMSESLFATIISIVIAYGFVLVFLPVFNVTIDRNMVLDLSNSWLFHLAVIFATLVMGSIAYSFLIVKLSTVNPIGKSLENSGLAKRFNVKGALITFQFSASLIIIIFTILIMKQISFVKNKDLGFEKEHILYDEIETYTNEEFQALETIKEELLRNPNILNISYSEGAPFHQGHGWGITWEGGNDQEVGTQVNYIDFDFLETYNIELIEGRAFSQRFPKDLENGCIINETALKIYGWTDPIGKKIFHLGGEVNVIGVVKDFHYRSVGDEIGALLMPYGKFPGEYNMVSVKTLSDNISDTKRQIESLYSEYLPNQTFDFRFLDSDVNLELMDSLEGAFNTACFFAILIIFLSSIGLIGLVSFITRRKIKEIGIRKVNGAKIKQVVKMLNWNLFKWITPAFVIACPIAWLISIEWLEGFAYKTAINWWIFVIAGAATMTIALLTVSWQTYRAATKNPVESLRYE